jgi:hypothetical protein
MVGGGMVGEGGGMRDGGGRGDERGERGKDGAKTSPIIFPLLPGFTPNLALQGRQHP